MMAVIGIGLRGQGSMAEIENAALALLARREHTHAELLQKLGRKFPLPEVEPVLELLASQELQSDRRYTEQYVRMRSSKGYGPVRIRRELQEKGVSSTLIDEYLDDDDRGWLQLAKAVVDRRFGPESVDSYPQRAKRGRFLQQRGFPVDLIWRCLEE